MNCLVNIRSVQASPDGQFSIGANTMMPRFNIEQVRQKLNTTFPTATAAVKALEDLGIVLELTGQKKNRSYSYQAYIELLSR